MVHWYHAIFSAYGHWLPNDPRGSWSDFVHSYELYKFGGAPITVKGKRSYAHDPHDASHRREAKTHLKFPPARFEDPQRQSIAKGIERACDESRIAIHACAIGHDHIHLICARHPVKQIEEVVRQLKSFATKQMNADGTHPMTRYASRSETPTPWSVGLWSVFLNDREQLAHAMEYVERHPMKEGLAAQRWSFLKPVAPFHPAPRAVDRA